MELLLRRTALLCIVAVFGCKIASAQQTLATISASKLAPSATEEVPASQKTPAIEFFQPVPFKEVLNLSIFKSSDGILYLAPAALKVNQDSVSVVYRSDSRVVKGILSFSFTPILSASMTDDEVVRLVKTEYPDARVNYVVPRLAHAEASLLQKKFILSPFSTTVTLGQWHTAQIPVDGESLDFLLNGRTTDVPLGSVSLVFSVRGYELDLEGKPAVSDRRFMIGGYIDGGCARSGRSYIDAQNMTLGCKLAIAYDHNEALEIQTILKRLGLYRGELDGIIGPLSRQALRDVQRIVGSLQTGKLDYFTHKAIKSGELERGLEGNL